MTNPFDDIFNERVTDPNEAAQRHMRSLNRRFYVAADLKETDGGFAITLDGRPVRTPARRPLVCPSRVLAERTVAEWQAQGEYIDPARMPLTRLANTIIDGVAQAQAEVTADIAKYLGSDLLFYRADGPERLIARQQEQWTPILTWAAEIHGARFLLAQGIVFVAQPDTAIAAMRRIIPESPWPLGAVHVITTLTGSALIALALAQEAIAPDAAWTAAHVDEDWNMDLWGHDEGALARRASRRAEFDAAALVLSCSRGK
ncbi:MAG: ATP12 family protein [Xanthobacteraceae bacterium]